MIELIVSFIAVGPNHAVHSDLDHFVSHLQQLFDEKLQDRKKEQSNLDPFDVITMNDDDSLFSSFSSACLTCIDKDK